MTEQKQMSQPEWFAALDDHKKGRTLPEKPIDQISTAMDWWNSLPKIDRAAQSESIRSAADIRLYYWAAELEGKVATAVFDNLFSEPS